MSTFSHRGPTLRPLDIAAGVPLGLDPIPSLARADKPVAPIVAFEQVLSEALRRPPCLFSFSGGRDSSALLAVAARVARREGLDLPIPTTLVFPGSADTEESEWQALVVRHIGLTDWLRIEVHDELDAVGSVATDMLKRHGLLWPYNVHFHLPIIEHAAGGSVVTGIGGDEVGACSASARAERLLTTRHRPRLSDLVVVGLAASPAPVRTMVHRRRFRNGSVAMPWLTMAGSRELEMAQAASEGALPLGWEAKIRRWLWRDRYFRVCQASFDVVGSYHDVSVVHPFLEGPVLDSLAHTGGFRGFGNRADLLRRLFVDVLPDEIIQRRSKATFGAPLWTDTTSDFVRAWSGQGIDTRLVDPDALRRHWMAGDWTVSSTTLLQAAWLHDHCPPD